MMTMMRRKGILIGLGAALTFLAAFAACGDKATGDFTNLDAGNEAAVLLDEITGNWGTGDNVIFVLNADGSGSLLGPPAYSFKWRNNGHTLTLSHSELTETVHWTITHGTLIFSNPTGVIGSLLVDYTTPPLYPWEKISGGEQNGDQIVPTDASYFTFNSATGTITGYSNDGPKAVIIPSSINGITVTKIGDSAFAEKQLTGVVIPNSVTSIGGRAFINNNPLISVTIGANVTTGFLSFGFRIGNTFVSDFSSAYDNYGKLAGTYTRPNTSSTTWTKQTGGNTVIVPGDFTFDSATGTITGYTGSGGAIIIPSAINGVTVKAIGSDAFKSNQMTSITIPSSVTMIGSGAFRYCTELTSVIIPESVTSIGAYSFTSGGSGGIISFHREYGAFDDCYALTSVTIPARLVGQFADKFNGYSNLALIITGTGSIPADAFKATFRQSSNEWSYCTGITSVTIGDGVTDIASGAFRNCTGITSISIGAGVSHMVATAFDGLSALERITVASANTHFSSVDGILYNKGRTLMYLVPQALSGAITIPEGITSIKERAFAGRTGRISVSIPSSVETIDAYAFSGCTGLTSVTIPNHVNLPILESLNITPDTRFIDGVSTIRSNAFSGCTNLTTVIFKGAAIYDHDDYESKLWSDLITLITPNPSLFSQIQVIVHVFNNEYNRGFYDNAFPEGGSGAGGNALKTAYLAGGAGTYKRQTSGSTTWVKQ